MIKLEDISAVMAIMCAGWVDTDELQAAEIEKMAAMRQMGMETQVVNLSAQDAGRLLEILISNVQPGPRLLEAADRFKAWPDFD